MMRAVERYTRGRVTVNDLRSHRCDRPVARMRHIVMFLARRHTLMSYPKIGQYLGDRDHTTIMYGVARIEARLLEEPELRFTIAEIETLINIMDPRVIDAQAAEFRASYEGLAPHVSPADEDAHGQGDGVVRGPRGPGERPGGQPTNQTHRRETV